MVDIGLYRLVPEETQEDGKFLKLNNFQVGLQPL